MTAGLGAGRPRLSGALMAVAAGLAVAFSMPPWGWWPLAMLGVAVFDRTLAQQSTRRRFLFGFSFGVGWWFVATLWMVAFTPPGFVIFGVLSSLFYAVAAVLIPPERGRRLGLIAMFVLVALIQWNWPFGGVPLASLAISQADGWLAPTARSFGSLTLVGLVATIGVTLSAAIERSWRPVAGGIAVIAAAIALTAIAPVGHQVGELDVAIVQGGGPQGTRALFTSSREVFERHVAATRLVEPPVDFVLWPENAITVRGDLEDNPEFAELVELAQLLDAPLSVGVFEQFPDHLLNAQEIITPEGQSISRYDKVLLVPFGETVPFRSIIEWAAPTYLPSRDVQAGTTPAVLTQDDDVFGVSISWEIFFDKRARDAINNGGQILLNPTNGSSYTWTIVQSQQIASSRLRARETDRYVLQAAPTGFSAIITPDGEVIDRTSVGEQAVVQGTVQQREGLTWAVRFGYWPMSLLAGAALFVGWLLAWCSRNRGHLEHDGAGPVVHDRDDHVGAESPRLDPDPAVS